MRYYSIQQVVELTDTDEQWLLKCIYEEWITPNETNAPGFDEEDLARIKLIQELTHRLGVNDDAIPIILHLIDQIHCLQSKVKDLAKD